MSGADFQALATVGAVVSFTALLWSVCFRHSPADFDAAAQLPFDDPPGESPPPGDKLP